VGVSRVTRRRSINLRVLVVVLIAGLAAGAVALYVAARAMTDLAEVGLVERTTDRTDRARQMIADRLAVARAQLTAASLLAQVDRTADVPTALSAFVHGARVERDGESLELVRHEVARRSLLTAAPGATPQLIDGYVAVRVEVGGAVVTGLVEVASLLPRGPGQASWLEPATDPRLDLARVIVARRRTAAGEVAIATAGVGDGLSLRHEASLAGARAEVAAAMRKVIGWTVAITAVVVVLLAWTLTRRVTRPMRALAGALRHRHDDRLVLPPLHDDEIGELGAAIAAMHGGLAHDAKLVAVSAELARDVGAVQEAEQVLELLAEALTRAHPIHGWRVIGPADAGAALAAADLALTPAPRRAATDGAPTPTLQVAGDALLVPLGDDADGAVAIGHGPISDVDRRSVEVLCRTAAAAIRSLSLVAAATLNDKLALIGRMSASVAHEMNNPLAYVTLNLNLLDEQTTGPGQELVRATLNGVNRLARIVSDLSRAARGEADAPGVEDLGALVADEVRVARARSGSTVELSMAPTAALWVRCERGRVAQAVLNLLVNALDAAATTPGGGRVEVSLRCDGDARRRRGPRQRARASPRGPPPPVRRVLHDQGAARHRPRAVPVAPVRRAPGRQRWSWSPPTPPARPSSCACRLGACRGNPRDLAPCGRGRAGARPSGAPAVVVQRQSRSTAPTTTVACWSSTTKRRSSAPSSAPWPATPTSRRPSTIADGLAVAHARALRADPVRLEPARG
jgi:two-component sensor histidine kinase